MMSANIRTGGGGGGAEQSDDVVDFSIIIDNTRYTPWAVDELEEEQAVQDATVQDQCGNVERTQLGTDAKRVRVTGFVRKEGVTGELTKDVFREELYSTKTIEIVSELYSGEIDVQNAIISQAQEKKFDGHNILVFPFQLQLGAPQGEQGGLFG